MLSLPDSTNQSQNRNGAEGGVEFDFPDEVAIEILSRLSAIDVVRFRSVCKKWRDLTDSQQFKLLHLQRSLPMVLFEEYIFDFPKFYGLDHYLMDQWWEPLQTAPKSYKIGNLCKSNIQLSMGGLIVMRHQLSDAYRITNPMYHENVEITFMGGLMEDHLYGVFCHPSLMEYRTLWRVLERGQYKILTLGSKPCLRDINNPWSHRSKACGIPPILIGEHLYWVVKPEAGYTSRTSFPPDMIEFDIRNEEFNLIPSPVPGAYKCNEDNINLLDIGGLLSLIQTSPLEDPLTNKPFEVNIWMLKNRERQLWTMSSYSLNTDGGLVYGKPTALVHDELLIHNSGVLFTCNLKLGTVRKFEDEHTVRKFEDDGDGAAFFRTHVMSLLSLRNCKSEIFIWTKGGRWTIIRRGAGRTRQV